MDELELKFYELYCAYMEAMFDRADDKVKKAYDGLLALKKEITTKRNYSDEFRMAMKFFELKMKAKIDEGY